MKRRVSGTETTVAMDSGPGAGVPSRNDQARPSEPAPPFEPDQRNDRAEHDHCDAERIAPRPVQFRHELEIHAVDAGDHGRRNADHSFHVPARTGRTDAEVRAEMLDALAGWVGRVVAAR